MAADLGSPHGNPCDLYAASAGVRWRGALGAQRWSLLLLLVALAISLPLQVVLIHMHSYDVGGIAGWAVLVLTVGPMTALVAFGYRVVPATDRRAQEAAPPGVFATRASVVSFRPAGTSRKERRERVVGATQRMILGTLYVEPAGVLWIPPRSTTDWMGRFHVPWTSVDHVAVLPRLVTIGRRCLAVELTLRDGSVTIFQTRAGRRLCVALAEVNAPPAKA